MTKDLPALDPVDADLLRALVRDGRRPNNALADDVRVAPSTALTRIRLMRERGVLRGIHADVDPTRVGRPVQAVIALRLRTHDGVHVRGFAARVAELPDVIQVFHVSGGDDYLVHVAVESPERLRDFALESLTSDPAVAHAETHLVFEHRRGGFMST
jgi:DNA-binding Lrp family transcriptional regulator